MVIFLAALTHRAIIVRIKSNPSHFSLKRKDARLYDASCRNTVVHSRTGSGLFFGDVTVYVERTVADGS